MLGVTSGVWVSYARKRQIPTVPDSAPRPPVKPSSETLMRALKGKMRKAAYLEKVAENPAFAEATKEDDLPLPGDYEAWEEYERLRAQYQQDSREYERQEKIALETFPNENRKVFSGLIDCISEASVQDLKRSPEGAKAFEECDSFNFLKLALREHQYLSPAVLSAAVARAKDDFERLKQGPADTIIEHINEFRRRLEVYVKSRGPDQPVPYADFDLRDLLLRSLYRPTWGSWIEGRYDTDTMPTRYEELVTALKKAETTKILRAASPIDPFQPTAHATGGRFTETPPNSPGPTKCSVCGNVFCPKKPQFTRCDKCHEEYVKQRKDSKKSGKGKDTKKRGKGKGSKERRAHATTAGGGYEDEESSDDEDDKDEGQEEGTSFSCICSTRATFPSDGLIYLDNCSNLNVIRDQSIALNIRRERTATRISGSIPGTLTAQTSAELGDLGRGCHDPKFSRNLISEDAAIRAGYRVTRDSSADDKYYLTKEGRKPLIFSSNGEGTFSITTQEFRRHFSDLYGVANMTDVVRTDLVFTKRQRERAGRYHFDHSHCLGHLHHDRVIMALRKGLIINAPYTEADVRNALIIHGPCGECAKSKGTRHRQTGHHPVMPEAPGERLAGDLFSIGGVLFSIISCRLIKLRCVTRMQNKGAGEIIRAVKECIDVWKGYGAKPKVLSWDQEPALVHCAAEIWARHSLKVEHTAPDAHERVAERDVRTVKEHVYATIASLGHAVDAEMIEGIVRDTVTLLNFFPNSETMDGTPRTFLDGERLDYERWSRVYAGQVAEFEMPYAKQINRGTRKELGYVIGHQGDNPVVRLLPTGKKLVVRSGHVNVIAKTPAILSLIEKGIQGAKRQRFNDLLCEMEDFYAEENETAVEPTMRVIRDEDQSNFDREQYRRMEITEEIEEHISPRATEVMTLPQPEELGASEMIPDPNVVNDVEQGIVNSQERASSSEQSQNRTPPKSASPVRRSTRTGAQKPPGYYAKLNSGESIADYTACHLRANECSKLYGQEATKKAGINEVLNMIRDRGAAKPQDFRKLSQRVIQEAIPSFMFFKAKDLLPNEQDEHTDGMHQSQGERLLEVNIRGRWVGGGNHQEKGEVLAERVAPTARGASHNLLMDIAAFEGRPLMVGDIPSAYLQAKHVPANGKAVYIVADRHTTSLIVEALPEYADYVRPNGTMILKVEKAMYGLVESAWLWYRELEKHFIGLGYTVSSSDRGLFFKRIFKNGKCIASNIATVHVDDIISAASPNAEGKRLQDEFWESMEKKWPGIKLQTGPKYKHLSWNIVQDKTTGEIRKSQRDYLLDLVSECKVNKEHKLPCRSDILTIDHSSPRLCDKDVSRFRSILQKVAYARDGRPDFDFAVCYLQSKQSSPTEQDWNDLQHLLGYIKRFPEKEIVFKPRDLQLRGLADASFNITEDGRSYFGYIITLGHSLITSKGGRIKSIVRSSTEAEISAVNEIASEILWCRDLLEELGYEQHKIAIEEDNMSCITMLQKEPRSFHSKSRHVRVKWAFFRQEYAKRTIRLHYCPTDKMKADLLTKPMGGKAHNLHTSAILEGRGP